MDHEQLKQLAAVVLQEAKSLLESSNRAAIKLTDPVAESGRPSAQGFTDNRAGDVDYELWIRLLQLHCAARHFLGKEPDSLPILKEQIAEVEKLVSKRAE